MSTNASYVTDPQLAPQQSAGSGPADPHPQGGYQPGTNQAVAASAPAVTSGENGAFALTSFMLGIASVVFGWTLIAPVTGLIFGTLALRRRTGERTLALWGVWLNGIMLALTALGIIAILVMLSFGLFALPFIL